MVRNQKATSLRQPQQIPFTPEAFEKLQREKTRLMAVRVEVMARLAEARQQGDLKENGAYQYAKFELGNIGRQLRDINFQLHNGYVVKPTTTTSATAQFGSTVTIENTVDQTQRTFMLVSQYESNPIQNKLSTESPIGAAIFGKQKGQSFTITTPAGEKSFVITNVA